MSDETVDLGDLVKAKEIMAKAKGEPDNVFHPDFGWLVISRVVQPGAMEFLVSLSEIKPHTGAGE